MCVLSTVLCYLIHQGIWSGTGWVGLRLDALACGKQVAHMDEH